MPFPFRRGPFTARFFRDDSVWSARLPIGAGIFPCAFTHFDRIACGERGWQFEVVGRAGLPGRVRALCFLRKISLVEKLLSGLQDEPRLSKVGMGERDVLRARLALSVACRVSML
jgi:hypothetical protein